MSSAPSSADQQFLDDLDKKRWNAAEQTPRVSTDTLQVFEARFGNKDGQHALLEYPQHMRDFFLRLFTKADLPDTAPAGVAWDPFVRGWREDNHYIFSLTKADITATRPGMISTRMLAVPLEHAKKWARLESLFAVLHETNRTYVPELTIQSIAEDAPLIVPPALLACVAHHLINEAEPAVIIGQNGFEVLISALWQKMPPELRPTFSFGFSFTPADLKPSRVNIAAVPKSCDSRWSSYKFKCSADRLPPSSESVAVFLNDSHAREFHQFLNDLQLVFSSFSDYGRFARLWNYWQRRGENDRNLTHALLRSLGTLLPEPDIRDTIRKRPTQIHIPAEFTSASGKRLCFSENMGARARL